MAGVVLVDGREALKPGALTRADAAIEIVAQPAETRYVSRGGLKLDRSSDDLGGARFGPPGDDRRYKERACEKNAPPPHGCAILARRP